MSDPYRPGFLHRDDVRRHHYTDSLWQIAATVLAVWCVGLGVWVALLHRKERR